MPLNEQTQLGTCGGVRGGEEGTFWRKSPLPLPDFSTPHKRAAPRRRRRGAAEEGGGYSFCKEEDDFAIERTDSARHL